MIAAARQLWQARTATEQRTLTLGGILLLALLVLALGILPLLDAHSALAAQLPQARADTAAMETAVAEAARLRLLAGPAGAPVAAPFAATAPVATLEQAARAAGLLAAGDAVAGLPAGQVELRLARVSFDAFLDWSARQRRDTGFNVASLEADALDEPGMVRLRAVLAPAANGALGHP